VVCGFSLCGWSPFCKADQPKALYVKDDPRQLSLLLCLRKTPGRARLTPFSPSFCFFVREVSGIGRFPLVFFLPLAAADGVRASVSFFIFVFFFFPFFYGNQLLARDAKPTHTADSVSPATFCRGAENPLSIISGFPFLRRLPPTPLFLKLRLAFSSAFFVRP